MRQYAFVCRPADELVEIARVSPRGVSLDLELAKEQWESYVDALNESGWETIELPHMAGQAAATFVETHAISYDRLLIMTHTARAERLAERICIAQAGAARGLEVIWTPADAHLDGGDVLKYGGTVWVGLSPNTDRAGAQVLTELLATYGVSVTTVTCPKVDYLKEAVTALPDGTLIAAGGGLQMLQTCDRVLPAPEPTGARVLLLGGNRLMLPASAPRTATMLRERGFDVLTVDLSEFERFGAGPTSLSVRVRGDC
ncbi:hypothetical protein BSZ39_10845 [Bowdeniella nasicola]|uniref:Dimethylargininase n=1 Tax=Bowdeniella nasicola TaxID=208480 RepID=A0A1Q5Q0H8_9ACTO|nr:hypothetical protein [Bowdeniella nasicola]OKL53182.1 hypothetical protein BSZ39_10845 [Bowdeniella nasicola]